MDICMINTTIICSNISVVGGACIVLTQFSYLSSTNGAREIVMYNKHFIYKICACVYIVTYSDSRAGLIL